MRIQLAARYMKELGTDSGAYVVIWMNAPNLGTGYKPLWRTTTEAKSDLRKQAEALKIDGRRSSHRRRRLSDARGWPGAFKHDSQLSSQSSLKQVRSDAANNPSRAQEANTEGDSEEALLDETLSIAQ